MEELILTNEQRQFLIDSLQKHGKVRIKNVLDLKFTEEKGKELIDPRNPSKGFRVTDMNSYKVSSVVERRFKDEVKGKRVA